MREFEFDVVAGRRYRLGIDAWDMAGREGPRGLVASLQFLDADGSGIEGTPEGAVRTDRHGDVVYLPTHAGGADGARFSENVVVAPDGATRLRVRVRNWKCSEEVALRSVVELVAEREPTLGHWEFAVKAGKPHALALTLRSTVEHARAAILAFEFVDGAGDPVQRAYEGCLSSKKYGAFRYLRSAAQGASVSVPVLTPAGAARVRLTVHPWKVDLGKLELLGEPALTLEVPEGLDGPEWSLLSSKEWTEPCPIVACGDGLVYLALDCVGIQLKRGVPPAVLVDFIDSQGDSLARKGDPYAARPSIGIDHPTVLGRRGGVFPCPSAAVAVRFMLAPTESYSLLVRQGVDVQHVPAPPLPGPPLLPLGAGHSATSVQAISSLWSMRLEVDGFAADADNRGLEIVLSMLDAAGSTVPPHGALLECTRATAVVRDNVVKVSLHSTASGTQGIVRFSALIRILPPRGAVTLSVCVTNPRAHGVAVATELRPYDSIVTERLVPESVGEILGMDDRYPAKVAELGDAYFEAHGRDPRIMSHLLDAYRRLGALGRLEAVARRAASASGGELSKLRVKARLALASLRELDIHWLPMAGLRQQLSPRTKPDSKLRVAHLFKTTVPVENTGGAIRCLNIVNFQRRIGMQPLVVTPLGYPDAGGTGQPWEREVIDGVPYFRLNCVGRHDLRAVASTTQLEFTAMLAARLLSEEGTDIVQASSGYRGYEQALVGLAVSRALRIPFVYEVRSYHEHTWRGMTDWLLEAEHTRRRVEQENRCMREADAVVTICETMRQGLVERGIPADKIFVVPNSVDLDKFREAKPQPELRERLGLAQDLVVGYISNVSEREGHHVLLRAVAHARASGIEMKCLIVGAGRELRRLRELAAELGVAEHVVFTGEVAHDQVPAYYALIDIFVVPRVEDFASDYVTPMKPFEAMAMRRPLVVSDRPALLEVVGGHGRRGLVFRAGDHLDLARRLKELASSPQRRDALAETARQWIETERAWDQTIRIYERVYSYANRAAEKRLGSKDWP